MTRKSLACNEVSSTMVSCFCFHILMHDFVQPGGIVSISGVYKVRPRIIFITDGLPTDEAQETGHDLQSNVNQVGRLYCLIFLPSVANFHRLSCIAFGMEVEWRNPCLPLTASGIWWLTTFCRQSSPWCSCCPSWPQRSTRPHPDPSTGCLLDAGQMRWVAACSQLKEQLFCVCVQFGCRTMEPLIKDHLW